MSVNTTYSEMADSLNDKLDECIDIARRMLDRDIWGHDEYQERRDLEQYIALRNVKDSVIGG